MRIEFEGRYQLWVERDGEITQETPWFDNLITDNGLDRIGTGYSVNCYVGSGTTPPAYTDTQLESYVAGVGYLTGWYSNAGLSETPQYRSRFRRYRAGIGAISGQVSEVGIGPGSTNLVSRALLPVILVLDGELDRLYVTWEFRQCIPAEPVEGAVLLAGTTRVYIAQPIHVDGASHTSYWNINPGERIYYSRYDFQHSCRLRIDGLWVKEPSTGAWAPRQRAYVWGSRTQHLYISNYGPGLIGSIDGFHFMRGASSGFGNTGCNGGAWEVIIDPPIQIEDHQRLHVDFAISWDRCDATATPEDPVDPSYPALFYDIEITESTGRFELAAKTTDTGNSLYSIIDLTSEEPTLLDYTAISAVNTHTASTGLAVESLGSTDYGYLVRFYADTLTDPFAGAVILGHQMRNCDDDVFTQYATMRDLRAGGGQFFAPRCTPTLNRTDFVAEFYIRRTTYARFAITSSDTSDVEVEVYQHSAAEPFLPINLIDAINAETVNTGVAAELARELRGGLIVRVQSANAAAEFSATVAYEYDAYNWSARAWARTSDSGLLAFLWTPVEIETALWLDAADSSTITESGGAVSVWADKSGNGRDAVQSNPARMPVHEADALNSQSVVRFGGSAITWLPLPDLSDLTEGMVVAVIKCDSDPPTQSYSDVLWHLGDSGATTHYPFSDGIVYETFGSTVRRTCGNPTDSLSVPHLYSVGSAPGFWENRINASVLYTMVSNTVEFPTLPNIGTNPSGDGRFNGYFAEIVLLPTVDDSIRQKIEGYLAHKWDLTANLPVDHPYKSVAP